MPEIDTSPTGEEVLPEDSAQEVIESIDGAESDADNLDATDATDEELEEVMDSDEATDEEKAEAKQELVKRLKLKVNGREVEEEIDFNDEDRLREILQKGYAADERFQKASNIEKRAQKFAELIQKDPLKALQAAGHDMDKIAEQYMEQRIQELQKSPEQRRLEELERQIEEERERNQTLERERQEAQQARAQEEYSRQLDDEITSALENSSLPKSPYVVKRIAENLMLAMDEGYEDVDVQDIMPIVERQIKEEIRQMFELMPEEIIEKTLGNNVTEKLRKRRINRQKKAPVQGANVKPTGTSEQRQARSEKKVEKVAAKDFFKNF